MQQSHVLSYLANELPRRPFQMPSVMNNEILLKNRVENGMLAACLSV
jgi:hypothetical protein